MNKPQLKTAYLPFKGGSTYGKGNIRETIQSDSSIYKYVFENEKGKIFFDNVTDRQLKGLEIIFTQEEYNEHIRNIIENTLETAAENACGLHCTDYVEKERLKFAIEQLKNMKYEIQEVLLDKAPFTLYKISDSISELQIQLKQLEND